MRALELFAGIGGLHAACPWLQVVTAVDINRDSQTVYSRNFLSPYLVRELETIPLDWLASQQADLWWMSPPCTPFTRKGQRRDAQDVRTRGLLYLIDAAAKIRPASIVVENVFGFEESQTFSRLVDAWKTANYKVNAYKLCPTQLGWPNRRPRVYVFATQGSSPTWTIDEQPNYHTLQQIISECGTDTDLQEDLYLDPKVASKYHSALDVVDLKDPKAIAACFGSSYGRAITRAGSYVATKQGLRRFSPREVANILGFPSRFVLPDHLSMQRLWQLLGNSLSLPVISHIMRFTRS